MGAERDPEMAQREPSPIPEETPSNSLLTNSRCCCCFPCFGSRRSNSSSSSVWWEHPWLSRGIRALKKIREWSEIVAGPKWKTFIRRFNRHRGSGNNRHGRFQYDPLSYALNFDEGQGQHAEFEDCDDYGGFRDFSSRYAAVSGSGKPLNMDATT